MKRFIDCRLSGDESNGRKKSDKLLFGLDRYADKLLFGSDRYALPRCTFTGFLCYFIRQQNKITKRTRALHMGLLIYCFRSN